MRPSFKGDKGVLCHLKTFEGLIQAWDRMAFKTKISKSRTTITTVRQMKIRAREDPRWLFLKILHPLVF